MPENYHKNSNSFWGAVTFPQLVHGETKIDKAIPHP